MILSVCVLNISFVKVFEKKKKQFFETLLISYTYISLLRLLRFTVACWVSVSNKWCLLAKNDYKWYLYRLYVCLYATTHYDVSTNSGVDHVSFGYVLDYVCVCFCEMVERIWLKYEAKEKRDRIVDGKFCKNRIFKNAERLDGWIRTKEARMRN